MLAHAFLMHLESIAVALLAVGLSYPRDHLASRNAFVHGDIDRFEAPCRSGNRVDDLAATDNQNAVTGSPRRNLADQAPDNDGNQRQADREHGRPVERPRYPNQLIELLGRREALNCGCSEDSLGGVAHAATDSTTTPSERALPSELTNRIEAARNLNCARPACRAIGCVL
jgi:hypothetical protein